MALTSIVTRFPWQDTAGATTPDITMPAVNFGADYAKQNAQIVNGNRIINLTTPTDCAETIQFSFKDVDNIYAGKNVAKAYWNLSTAGRSITVGHVMFVEIVDSEDPTKRILAPVTFVTKASCLLSSYITPEIMASCHARHAAMFTETADSNEVTFWNRHLRGATLPVDIA